MQIKLIFTTKVAHLNLIMKVRVFGTRKWPISTVNNELACSRLSDGNDDALVNGTRKSEREPGKREWWRKKRKGAPPLTSSLPFNVRARALSNSRKRLSRSLLGLTGQSDPLKQEGSIFPVAALVRYVKWSHLYHRQYPGKLMLLPSNYLWSWIVRCLPPTNKPEKNLHHASMVNSIFLFTDSERDLYFCNISHQIDTLSASPSVR